MVREVAQGDEGQGFIGQTDQNGQPISCDAPPFVVMLPAASRPSFGRELCIFGVSPRHVVQHDLARRPPSSSAAFSSCSLLSPRPPEVEEEVVLGRMLVDCAEYQIKDKALLPPLKDRGSFVPRKHLLSKRHANTIPDDSHLGFVDVQSKSMKERCMTPFLNVKHEATFLW